MDDNLIGYLLNALDPETHRQTQVYLDRDPEARQRLELLRQSLAPLALDQEHPEPPRDLVVRTLAHVAEFCCQDLPHAPELPATQRVPFPRIRFRRWDILVAACLALVVGGVFMYWVSYVRSQHDLVACQNDLKEMYLALDSYRQAKGHFPDVNKIAKPPKNVAGLVLPMLVANGYLPKKYKVHGTTEKTGGLLVEFEKALAMKQEEFERQAPGFTPWYGYALGYRDGDGALHGPDAPPGQACSNLLPLMADAPPADGAFGNSPNHGGLGQNVLYLDGSFKFVNDRHAGYDGDDIYVNRFGKVAPGVGWPDSVIVPSEVKP
jgi:hypothetical protein